jgi:hypothetical protein
LNYGKNRKYSESEKIKFDRNGVPTVKYGDDFKYNPVTISQYELMRYGQYLYGNENAFRKFIDAADKLLEVQNEAGALVYNFEWKYYLSDETYQPGWVSGMAQGVALSVFTRAYYTTQRDKYIKAGNKAIEFMTTSIEEGGTMSTLKDLDPSLSEYIFFEEYISSPNNYTLNGFMFTLLGLSDWKALNKEFQIDTNIAQKYFDFGIKTLINILPYYDIGGFSAYDLGHITFTKKKEPHIGIGYHAVHIYLLNTLHQITNERMLKQYEIIWRYYVE